MQRGIGGWGCTVFGRGGGIKGFFYKNGGKWWHGIRGGTRYSVAGIGGFTVITNSHIFFYSGGLWFRL